MPNRAYGWLGKPAWDWLDLARYQYLQDWLDALGLPWIFTYHPPDKTPILNAISDPEVTVYFPNAHGDSYFAEIGTGGNVITASDVRSVLETRGPGGTPIPMKFSFLIHSDGMGSTDPGTWTDALRLGDTPGTVVIGVWGGMPPWKWLMWQLLWAGPFFAKVDQGMSFLEAYRRSHIGFKVNNMAFVGSATLSKRDLT